MRAKLCSVVVVVSTLGVFACGDLDSSAAQDSGDEVVAESGYLFGLTEEELLAIQPLVSKEYTAAAWLDHNRAPFECARYEDFCDLVGEDAAREITRDALFLALDGASLDEIAAHIDQETAVAEILWEAPEPDVAFRTTSTGTNTYPCGNHRLRTKVYKVKPLFAARYGKTNCTHQTDLGGGVWGGSQVEDMVAYVEIVGTSPLSSASASGLAHSLTTPNVYPGKYETVRGTCTGGPHSGATRTRTISVN